MISSSCRDILQQFLLSDATPRDSMCIAELDGFLHGIAAGPSAIPIKEWSLVVWGSGTPSYRSAEQEKFILDLLSRRYADIASLLQASPDDTTSIDVEDCDDSLVVASSWASGFLQAIELRSEAWRPLLQDRASGIFLLPLVNLYRESAEDYELPFSPELNRRIVSIAVALLPTCARRIMQFWRNYEDALSTRFLNQGYVIPPENSAADQIIDLLAAGSSDAMAGQGLISRAESVQPTALKTVGKSFETQQAKPLGFRDTLNSILRDKPSFGQLVDPVIDRTPGSSGQDALDAGGEPDELEAIMITDNSGRILSVNRAFTSVTGYSSDEVIGRTPRILKCSLMNPVEHAHLWIELLNRGHWHGHVWNRSRSGEPFLIRQTISRFGGTNDGSFGYISVFKKLDRRHVVPVDGQRSPPTV